VQEVTPRPCPLCFWQGTAPIGRVLHPPAPTVAGMAISLEPTEFFLCRCLRCNFHFKEPPIPNDSLLDCYVAADAGHWGEEPDPGVRRFDVIGQLLERHAPGPDILDVGCSNGALLSWLGDAWSKFGIEPSADAARMARARGVEILGSAVSELATSRFQCDAILMIDVLEHIPDPSAFLRSLRWRLKPQGIFLVVTADTDSFPWRLQKSRHWYCSLPEHVSFFSRSTFRWLARELEMVELESRVLSHHRTEFLTTVREALKNLLYVGIVRTPGMGARGLGSRVLERRAPVWLSARDHLFLAMAASPKD
jgi:SAM-dependent methyltransferase